jgi:succinyl-diaminopimelate desuccinylase
MNAIELTKSLISCPSITPENAGVLDILQEELSKNGFDCKRYKFAEEGTADVDNLFAKYGSEEPHFCFGGHTDVVPVGEQNAWLSNPFKPTEKDGKLYGRGASDMKSAIAAFVCAVIDFTKNNKFKGSISLLITNDEEGPAINGTKKVLEEIYKNGEKINSCLVGEPTCPGKLGEMIKIGRRGSLMANFNVFGKQGHVAYPQWTLNPINPLTRIINDIISLKLDEGSDDFPPSNIEIVKISSSDGATNVVPHSASGQLNIRYNVIHTADSLKKKLNDIVKEHAEGTNYQIDTEYYDSAEPFLTEKGKFTDIIKKSVDEVTGIDAKFSTTGGTSDARFFKDYCEVAEFGLIGETAHQVNENVSIEDINKLENIYKNILINYFK